MRATTHAELVDEIVGHLMARLRADFPLRHRVNVEGLAADCGVPLQITRKGGMGGTTITGDEVFGVSFIDLANATAYWLCAEGYLIAAGSEQAPYYTLSERGARLQKCRPATLD